jgi:hypothetical protein
MALSALIWLLAGLAVGLLLAFLLLARHASGFAPAGYGTTSPLRGPRCPGGDALPPGGHSTLWPPCVGAGVPQFTEQYWNCLAANRYPM